MAQPPIQDRSFWYSDLAFMPPEDKNTIWCAQSLFYMKLNGVQFLDTKRKVKYRKLERLELDTQVYKELIDPKTPMDSGGKAEYFAADFQANPIDAHLDNIIRAKLDKIGIENKLQVSEIDKFAKTQKDREHDKISYQHLFRELINEINKDLGFPPIKENEDPYKYVQSLGEKDSKKMADGMDTLLDYIRSQIKDSQSMALFEAYVYKGDIELAFELCIEHYLINLNKWRVKCEYFNNDLKNFNKACGRWYTDETTGRGTVEYIEPDELRTNAFAEKNGEDVNWWFYEKDISFAEFVRQFGMNLSDEELKEVFELNKYQGGRHGMAWKSAKGVKGSNANIRIGYGSILTQDAEKFSEKFINNKIPVWQRKPLSWLPDKRTPNKYKSEPQNKMYNVWYSFYYVPPPGERLQNNAQIDWAWQSRYIFNLQKDIDMYRFGVDMRYAKSTLVVWKDESRPSFMDIKQAFMPKIHTTWHKFQNCLVQDTTFTAIDWDFMMGILNATDEANKNNVGEPDQPTGGNGPDIGVEMFKMLKQGGIGFMKFRDKNGNVVVQDPSKFFVHMDSGHLDKAEKYLKIILDQYQMMTIALAQNDISEGQDAKPRTPVAGINAALASAQQGLWFIEKPVREFLIMFGERCVQYILSVIKERKRYAYTKRFDEMVSVIGKANAFLLDRVEDVPAEDIGITVDLEDVHANMQYVMELANKMADNNEIGRDVVGLVMNQVKVNYKFAYILLMVEKKRREQEQAEKEQLEFERAKELKQMDLQTAVMLNKAKGEAKDQNIMTQGKVDDMINERMNDMKSKTMVQQKEQLKNNRIDQDNNKAQLKQEEKVQDAL